MNAKLPEGEKEQLTVLGATSGDTGSAAIYGLRSKPSITIFILYPDGRVSPIQEAQMATVPDANVYCVAVEDSDFDTCQSIVKSCFGDAEFNKAHRLGAVNSINWARILAQIVYYFQAYFLLPEDKRKNVQFVVPTGNFGDILAGWYAKRLGLPCKQLVVATNENDILQRFFSTGRYEKPEEGGKATYSPAMDILLSSNFERLLWYLAYDTLPAQGTEEERRAAAQAQLNTWMEELRKNGRVDMGAAVKELAEKEFWAERVSDQEVSSCANPCSQLTDRPSPRSRSTTTAMDRTAPTSWTRTLPSVLRLRSVPLRRPLTRLGSRFRLRTPPSSPRPSSSRCRHPSTPSSTSSATYSPLSSPSLRPSRSVSSRSRVRRVSVLSSRLSSAASSPSLRRF